MFVSVDFMYSFRNSSNPAALPHFSPLMAKDISCLVMLEFRMTLELLISKLDSSRLKSCLLVDLFISLKYSKKFCSEGTETLILRKPI